MTRTRFKALFRDRHNLVAFLEKYGIGQHKTAFLTLTFKQNITKKSEAQKEFARYVARMRHYFRFEYIWVAEQQTRGAWHYHVLVSCDNQWTSSQWRKVSNFPGFTSIKFTVGSVKTVINYMIKYMLKDRRLRRVRYIGYSNHCPRVLGALNTFQMLDKYTYAYFADCNLAHKIYGKLFLYFRKYAKYKDLTYFLSVIRDFRMGKVSSDFVSVNLTSFLHRRLPSWLWAQYSYLPA